MNRPRPDGITPPELGTIRTRKEGGWIGVDLDGTLAENCQSEEDVWSIRPPIPRMLERVKGWLAEGKDVRIFTARVGCCDESSNLAKDDSRFAEYQRGIIESWCLEHLGQVIPVTATKDFLMVELWDDRAIRVMTDTGMTQEEWFQATEFGEVLEGTKPLTEHDRQQATKFMKETDPFYKAFKG